MSSPGFIMKILLDIMLTLQDWVMDWSQIYLFNEGGHVKWTVASICIIHLPGLAIMIGRKMSQPAGTRMQFFDFVMLAVTLLAYPVVIIYMGIQLIRGSQGVNLKMFKHMKIYDGLMESAYMFLIQLVVLGNQPPIGDFLGIPYGKLWFSIAGLLSSIVSLMANCAEYHVLYDSLDTNFRRQAKLMPYYGVHFLFRSFTIAILYITYRAYGNAVLLVLVIFNMCLTWHTHKKEATKSGNVRPHINFCTIVGGWTSVMVPSLAVFFRQTAPAKSVNYFYKLNILFTNLILLLAFSCLAVHLNAWPTVGKSDGGDYRKRNHLASCQDAGIQPEDWKMSELSMPQKKCTKQVDKELILRHEWWVMSPCGGFASNTTIIPTTRRRNIKRVQESVFHKQRHIGEERYLVHQDCKTDETPGTKFNTIILPIISILGAISTGLAFYKFEIGENSN